LSSDRGQEKKKSTKFHLESWPVILFFLGKDTIFPKGIEGGGILILLSADWLLLFYEGTALAYGGQREKEKKKRGINDLSLKGGNE